MLNAQLKTAWRNLLKNKSQSVINIAGLSVGIALSILIGLLIWDELSFDQYHQNHDRIAMVMTNQYVNGEIQTGGDEPMQMAPELRVKYGSYFKYVVTSTYPNGHILSYGDNNLNKSGSYMEPQAPEMLTLHMLKGTRAGLQDPASILLSASVAKAFFGEADPIGKLMKIDNKLDVKVTGVYEDLPNNTSFSNLGFISPWDLYAKSEDLAGKAGWGNRWFQTYVQIADNTDLQQVSAKIKNVGLQRINGDAFQPQTFLHPMNRWHLYSRFRNGVPAGGRIQFVWFFGIIGGFVLLLACINFMNLATARSEKRAKEVGIRKAIGSGRGQLILQFLGESVLTAFICFLLSLLLVSLILPWFNGIADKKLTILWGQPIFWLLCLGFTLFTGVLAGSYPALYLSALKPVKVLKGPFKAGRLAAVPRKTLVVMQFSISVTLIICTIIVFKQILFAKDRPIGFNRNGLLTMRMITEETRKNYPAFRDALLQSGVVTSVAQSQSSAMYAGVTNIGFSWRGKDPDMQDEIVTMAISPEFGKTINWQMADGRDFNKLFATDSAGFVLNQAAVKYMGFENPVGEMVNAFGRQYHVIGVVKDMVMQSMFDPVRPTIFYLDAFNRVKFISLRINPALSAGKALAQIESIFKKYNPVTPFEYAFADDDFQAKFQDEERLGKLAAFFTILAVFISCLGLYGLAAFVAEQRTREIGVRKVMGATVFNVWCLLSKDFMMLVTIALLIAIPAGYYFMHGWLQHYEYRAALSWWIFAGVALGALVLILGTVSFQTIKAAVANPVKSLRTE